MFKNRFVLILVMLSMLLVTLAVSQPFSKAPEAVALSQPPRPVIVPVTGVEEASPYIMDSATRSYIARGEAMRARNAIDSGTRSYIAWGEALERAKLNALDSGTRSYIAWGEALAAAGKLHGSGSMDLTSYFDATDYSFRHRELQGGTAESVDTASDRVPLDECFDVSLSELTACREASETSAP